MPEEYKKTKVGLVPEEWEIKKLSDISDEIKEVAGTGKYETLSISAGIGFVNQANKFGKELSGKQYEKYTVLRKGDFAYNKGNSKKYPQGCVYRLKDRDSAAVPNVFECFRIKEGNKNYIEQVFISGFLNRQLSKKINHGVRDDGLLNLTGEDFYKSYIIIPPLPEQEKIAAILQTEDKVIELQQKKIDELKRLKKGYLSKMFPKKGCNVPEIRFPGFTDPWEQRKLGDMMNVTSVKRIHQSDWTDSGVRFLRARDIVAAAKNEEPDDYLYISKEKYEEYSALSGKVGVSDLLVTGVGTIGVPYLVRNLEPLYFKDGNIIWFQNSSKIDGKFLFYSFSAEQIQGFINESAGIGTVGTYTIESGKKTPISLPNQIEQARVGEFFQQLDNLITLHQRKLEEEQKKKKALMQFLLTGIVRVKYDT
mgnify:CR=1 FL=1